jgi:hypothetical protein
VSFYFKGISGKIPKTKNRRKTPAGSHQDRRELQTRIEGPVMAYIMIRPDNDEATKITNGWGETVVWENPPVADLTGTLATEMQLWAAMKAHPEAQSIVFYGHGELDNLTAQTERIEPAAAVIHAVEGGVLPVQLHGYKLYAVACYAGTKLGPALAKAGCKFIGYMREFWIPRGFEFKTGKVVNEGCVAWLIENQSQAQVIQLLNKRWDDLIDDLTFGKLAESPEAFNAAALFLNNKNALCCY